jgi:uncharacterized membrane protein
MRIFRFVEPLRSSYWFIPSVMALMSFVLGAFMIWLDSGPGAGWLDGLGWYQSVKADGAQEVLSTLAGSMITVAGVVFSITIVALSYASSQYGPRVLTNFMSDRGNQVTLGTFIATFVFCVVVLRTIRSGDEAPFVPQLAVMVGLLFGLCSIGVLIYFIHHVPQSIHINNVVARIGQQLIDDAKRRLSEDEDRLHASDESGGDEFWSDTRSGEARAVEVCSTGYVQSIDYASLTRICCARDLIVRLRHRPGDFVHAGRALLEAWPGERVDDEAKRELQACYSTGTGRTTHGDLDFLISELVEIAARALSPGVNDPVTANTCVDWLGAAAFEFARHPAPSALHRDEAGQVRVLGFTLGFEQAMDNGFARIRQYVGGDMNAASHVLRTVGTIAAGCRTDRELDMLQDEAERLLAVAEEKLPKACLDEVRARGSSVLALLAERADTIEGRWLPIHQVAPISRRDPRDQA